MNASPNGRFRGLIAKLVVSASLIGAGLAAGSATASAQYPMVEEYDTCDPGVCIKSMSFDPRESLFVAFPVPSGDTVWTLRIVDAAGVTVEVFEYVGWAFERHLPSLLPGRVYTFDLHSSNASGEERRIERFATRLGVEVVPTARSASFGSYVAVPARSEVVVETLSGVEVARVTQVTPTTNLLLSTSTVLLPGTTYRYRMSAFDGSYTYRKSGEFTTRTMRLELVVDGMRITDDSDVFGAGELRAEVEVGSTSKWIWQQERSVETAVTAKSFVVNVSASTAVTTTTVPLKVTVEDNDCEGCSLYPHGLPAGSGSHSNADWATASTTLSIPPMPTGTSASTRFTVSVNSYVGFSATGTYRWVVV